MLSLHHVLSRPGRRSSPAARLGRGLGVLWLSAWLGLSVAAELPYDERADGSVLVQQALQQAREEHKELLVVFGANWCPDCRVLDSVLQGPDARDLARRFVLVKLDVGQNLDKNLDWARRFGIPVRKGIPAVAIVASDETLRYVTRDGELADARKLGGAGIVRFFERVLADTAPRLAPPPPRPDAGGRLAPAGRSAA